ncbi:hypothetical protein B296_00035798, partial [Ensete ventricosum]
SIHVLDPISSPCRTTSAAAPLTLAAPPERKEKTQLSPAPLALNQAPVRLVSRLPSATASVLAHSFLRCSRSIKFRRKAESVEWWWGDGVLAGVHCEQLGEGVRGGRDRRHGRGRLGPPPRHAPHQPAAAAGSIAGRSRYRPPPRLGRGPPPQHPRDRGPRRALPRHGCPPRLRRLPGMLPHVSDSPQELLAISKAHSYVLRSSFLVQNAMVFQVYAIFSRAFDSKSMNEPPSYRSVALSGVGTGALQSLILSPVELVKIKLQLQMTGNRGGRIGPISVAKEIVKKEGMKGIYRGLWITVLRDAPSHGVYFWTYEYAREQLHPGCRKTCQESLGTMLVAGGLAGVASWICCYPLDVVKSRLQAQSKPQTGQPPPKYLGIVDCIRTSVREEGVAVLFRGMGTAVARAFVVNGAIFSAYELALRSLVGNSRGLEMEET